jgi:hypothetical protein
MAAVHAAPARLTATHNRCSPAKATENDPQRQGTEPFGRRFVGLPLLQAARCRQLPGIRCGMVKAGLLLKNESAMPYRFRLVPDLLLEETSEHCTVPR